MHVPLTRLVEHAMIKNWIGRTVEVGQLICALRKVFLIFFDRRIIIIIIFEIDCSSKFGALAKFFTFKKTDLMCRLKKKRKKLILL